MAAIKMKIRPTEPCVRYLHHNITSVLDIACMAGIETLRGRGPAVLFRELVERQGSDGLWSGGYDLRVTEPDCRQPWIEARGLYYRDQRGLLTSATSVRALAGLIQDTVFI